MDVLSLLTAFGLAAGAGGRAAFPLLALAYAAEEGYYTPSPAYAWIVSEPVVGILSMLAAVEIMADLHPELSEWADLAGYLPSFVVGAIAFGAATGDVDANVLQLAASGVLGGGTAAASRFLRNQTASVFRDVGASVDDRVHTARSWAETGVTATAMAVVFTHPVAALGLVGVLGALIGGGAAYWAHRRATRCPSGHALPRGALVCAACHQRELNGAGPSAL